jgi:hypothetical protein
MVRATARTTKNVEPNADKRVMQYISKPVLRFSPCEPWLPLQQHIAGVPLSARPGKPLSGLPSGNGVPNAIVSPGCPFFRGASSPDALMSVLVSPYLACSGRAPLAATPAGPETAIHCDIWNCIKSPVSLLRHRSHCGISRLSGSTILENGRPPISVPLDRPRRRVGLSLAAPFFALLTGAYGSALGLIHSFLQFEGSNPVREDAPKDGDRHGVSELVDRSSSSVGHGRTHAGEWTPFGFGFFGSG